METSQKNCDDDLKLAVSGDQLQYCSPMLGGNLPGGTEDMWWGSGLERFNYFRRKFETTTENLLLNYRTIQGSGGDMFWIQIEGEMFGCLVSWLKRSSLQLAQKCTIVFASKLERLTKDCQAETSHQS